MSSVHNQQAPSTELISQWESIENRHNQRNFKPWFKWSIIAIVSFVELLTHLTSMMFAPGITKMQRDFDVQNGSLTTFPMTVYVLGFGLGPLLFSPLLEVYGRVIIYRVCLIIFTVLTVACALATNLNMLIGFRFIAGCFGAAPVGIGGSIVADLVPVQNRGAAMALYQIGPILANVLGSPIGGPIIQYKGWKWVFWIMAILAGFATALAFVVLRETHAPTIMRKLAARKQLNPGLEGPDHTNLEKPRTSQTLSRAFRRPFKFLFLSPVVICTASIIMMQSGIQNLICASLGSIFQKQYGFKASTSRLVYLGVTVGFALAAIIVARSSDRLSSFLANRRNEDPQPEFRLTALMLGIPLLSIGLCWYGWAAQEEAASIAPLLGLFFIGIGLTTIQLSCQLYVVDAFTEFAASVLAAATVARSAGGALIPLLGPPLYIGLGLGWGNTIPAVVILMFFIIAAVL